MAIESVDTITPYIADQIPKPFNTFSRENFIRKTSEARRMFESIFLDDLEDHEDLPHTFITLLNPTLTNHHRFEAFLNIAHAVLPNPLTQPIIDKFSYDQSMLPIDPKDYTLKSKIGKGGMNDVFCLESHLEAIPSIVLKTVRPTRPSSVIGDLIKASYKDKKDYEFVAKAFESSPELIASEHHLIVQGPRKNSDPVSASISAFIPGKIKDVFTSFDPQSFRNLMVESPSLQKNVKDFISVLDEHPELIFKELDLLGENNLAVIESEAGPRLLLLDPHTRYLAKRSLETQTQIKNRIEYLRELSTQLFI